MTKTLKTVTLGCKVNQYETEYVRQGLLRAGFHDEQISTFFVNQPGQHDLTTVSGQSRFCS